MTSISQINANRRNARKSTGPNTAPGKERIRDNALRHGLCSERIVLPFEDGEAYHLLRADLIAEHQPAGPTEMLLVDELAQAFWRWQRARCHETSLLGSRVRNLKIRCKLDDTPGGRHQDIDHYEGLAIDFAQDPRSYETLRRYESGIRITLMQCLDRIERLKRLRRPAAGLSVPELPPRDPADFIEIPTAGSAAASASQNAAAAPAVSCAPLAGAPEPPAGISPAPELPAPPASSAPPPEAAQLPENAPGYGQIGFVSHPAGRPTLLNPSEDAPASILIPQPPPANAAK
ncbi:MAG: hypothetical protein HYS04_22270 [Acidobacteria bacterium]|nr:hypothetical protein [Acidobacteriota bacterium]